MVGEEYCVRIEENDYKCMESGEDETSIGLWMNECGKQNKTISKHVILSFFRFGSCVLLSYCVDHLAWQE